MLYFVFVDFWGLSLPCHLLCLFIGEGGSSWIFRFFCKFNCSWSFSLSGCVSPGSRLHHTSISRSDIEGQVNYAIDDVRRQEACETSLGLGGRCLGAGWCPVAPPSGRSWQADLGDGVNCFLIYIYVSF